MQSILRTALATLALGAIALGTSYAATTAVTIPLKALNGSGENGSATLTQTAGGVQVVVSLKGAPADAQPTHVHIGTCGNINKAPEYPLVNTVGGKGTSTIAGVKLADLLKGKYAINVHKSTSDLATYVACGNITAK
jgi:Cu/Zn superoxide dismutase